MRVSRSRVPRGRLGVMAALMVGGLLAGCAETEEASDGDASGEVIEGTISDAMLPLPELRSRAPAAADDGEEDSGAGATGGGEVSDSGEENDAPAQASAAAPPPAAAPAAQSESPSEDARTDALEAIGN